MLEDDALRDVFLNTDEFAVSVTFAGSTFNGILDAAYSAINLTGEIDVSGALPTVLCKSSDVSNASYNDAITVDGINYTISEIMPDGTGMTLLALEQA